MLDQPPARLRAGADDHLQDAVGEPRLECQLGEAIAVSGVISDGLSTTVLPQASAGPIFHDAISSGKFHGAIRPTTPSGSWKVIVDATGHRDRHAHVLVDCAAK